MLATGCGDSGFRPLYASSSLSGSDVNLKLAQLEIAPIPGRVGQRIRNELIFQSTGGGGAAEPVYRLEIVMTRSRSPRRWCRSTATRRAASITSMRRSG